MLELKQLVVQKCIEHQQRVANNAKSEMQDHQKMANEYGPPRDRYDAFRNQLLRKRDLFAEQYQRSLNEVEILEKIDPDKKSEVAEFGSVVITNINRLFISAGIGKFNVDGQEYFAISAKVPIFLALAGKTKGDEFIFNGKKFQILDLL